MASDPRRAGTARDAASDDPAEPREGDASPAAGNARLRAVGGRSLDKGGGEVGTIEDRIAFQESQHAAALEAGQTVKADRIAARLEELRQKKAEQDDQRMLERADAGLPPEEAAQKAAPRRDRDPLDDEDSAEDDAPRRSYTPPDEDGAPEVLPPAEPSRPHARHWAVLAGFVVLVVLPTALAAWYLWDRATDRYVSRAAFSIRTEEVSSAIELLGGVAGMSGSSSSDTDILYSFIQSQEMVRKADARLDLRSLWARADPEIDPIFAYHPPGTIEDLTDYWLRVVKVYNDGSGLIDLEVQAFTPDDARALARVIYDEASSVINRLSAIAREDATSYAREELETAVEQLRAARVAMTQFRNRTQIVDPQASVQSQMGILSSLQQQMATVMVDLDILRQQGVGPNDPRIVQGERRVEVIEERIAEERRKLGFGSADGATNEGAAFADIIGEYESLQVDLQFAQESYTAARAAYDAAVAEARRQSRYLAAHVAPTLPERAEEPKRGMLLGLVAMFSFLVWTIVVLTGYALRDRR